MLTICSFFVPLATKTLRSPTPGRGPDPNFLPELGRLFGYVYEGAEGVDPVNVELETAPVKLRPEALAILGAHHPVQDLVGLGNVVLGVKLLVLLTRVVRMPQGVEADCESPPSLQS